MTTMTRSFDWRGGASSRSLALRLGLILGAMLALPVIGLLVLEGGLIAGCRTENVASGVLDGTLAWRIDKSVCRASKAPFYDVAIGAKDKPMATALTSTGEPVPLTVTRLPDGAVSIGLDRPWRNASSVTIRLRKSGAPAERFDLQAADGAPPSVSPELSGRAR